MLTWQTSNGLIEYKYALNKMKQYVEEVKQGGLSNLVWMVEHEPVYTAGTSTNTNDLLDKSRFPVIESGRGGQYTYHGPGQRVIYPIIKIKDFNLDVHSYVHLLEKIAIDTLQEFAIAGETRPDRVGIWVKTPTSEEKIGAIGIRISHGIAYHGMAININPDLSHFSGIVPCGINNFGVTSLAKLGVKIAMSEFDDVFKQKFESNIASKQSLL